MKVCICGYGIVGQGVVEILDKKEPGKVKYIFTRQKLSDHRFVDDFNHVLKDDSVEIIVEAMGGLKPSFSMMKKALQHQKHVVTSNKELVEKHGASLHEIARKHHVSFLFEASVGGGMPLISTLRHGLNHENIESVEAILNGTSNYILTQMRLENISFNDALLDAQAKGFAEADPSDDILGFDAGRKIAILASIISKKSVDYQDVDIVGIEHISESLIQYAENHQQRIRLIAGFKIHDDALEIRVMPQFVSKNHPFYYVEGVDNAVLFKGRDVGKVLIQGQGAGRYPTASAMISDIYSLEYKDKPTTSWTHEQAKIITRPQLVLDISDFKEKELTESKDKHVILLESGA